jgi:hypothetical protein
LRRIARDLSQAQKRNSYRPWDADNSFAAEIDEIGNILIWQVILRFENSQVTLTMVESSGLYPDSIIQGELAKGM